MTEPWTWRGTVPKPTSESMVVFLNDVIVQELHTSGTTSLYYFLGFGKGAQPYTSSDTPNEFDFVVFQIAGGCV